jgi:hypothetical protein
LHHRYLRIKHIECNSKKGTPNEKPIFNGNAITLYHGSLCQFAEIDVLKGMNRKDSGKGFYATQTRIHAVDIAKRNQQIVYKRTKAMKEAYLYTYTLDTKMVENLNIKEFNSADLKWIKFILKNRNHSGKTHNFDIVAGPTADDDTNLVLNAYMGGLYGELGSDDALQLLIRNIEASNLPHQVFFGSKRRLPCCG